MADAKSVVSPSAVESPLESTLPAAQTPAQIDSRRAQQLLERALILSEHGDMPAAILACRQAIKLAPDAPQGFSMLGLLLERAGDNQGAIAAYERVLQMDPGSLLERESLARLRAATVGRRAARDLFVFDADELFDERGESVSARSAAAAAPQATPATPPLAIASPSLDGVAGSGGVFPRAVTSGAAAPGGVGTSSHSLPQSLSPSPSLMPTPSAAGTKLGSVAPAVDEFTTPPTVWQRIMARPSYYFRGAPLAATAMVSLCFLLWARNYAASREIAVASSGAGATTTIIHDDSGVSTAGDTALNQGTNPGATNPTASNPAAPAASGVSPGATSGVPVNPGGAAPSTPAATTPRPSATASRPSAPASNPSGPSVAPAPPRTSANGGGSNNDGGAMPDLPRPRLGGSTNNTEPTRVIPPANEDDGAVSTGGVPLNPGGAPNRDFTRVSPSGDRSTAPPRPDAEAARDERSALIGNPGAIAAATRAIEIGGGDTAMRYQRRAQLYLDSGDNTRAMNDFQTAISAYNDMIRRGDRVPLARAGIQASQRGVQLARARAGR